jgi:hypothetical protein
MAKIKESTSKTIVKVKKKRPGRHKKKVSGLKTSKNYVKKYIGQGR